MLEELEISPLNAVSAAAVLLVVYWVTATVWNVFRHPLSKFPGPVSASFSNFYYCRNFLGGRQPYNMVELHKKFGPGPIRIAPNELSFDSVNSWRDIYGPRKGHQPFIKSDFYDGGNFASEAHSIVSVRDPVEHGQMRKYLAPAFSERSLKDQEDLITEVVDKFINEIGKKGTSRQGIDMVTWFNLMTFDIIGSLAFGETFGGIASGKQHYWIAIVISSLNQGALADTFKRFPMCAKIVKVLFPGWLKQMVKDSVKHESHSMELVRRYRITLKSRLLPVLAKHARRMKRKTSRKDFMERILETREEYGLSDVQIAAHASDFVIAGSETTATTLACITYYLSRKPEIRKKLQDEVRSSFKHYSEINATSTMGLKYLQAVAQEAMRLYPPLPFALPRIVPAGGDTVDGHYLPGGTIVSTAPLAASVSEENFHDPWEFKPERWLGENSRDQLEASQPFSYGVRSCLGRALGWMELRTVLAKMHFTYDFKLLDDNVDWHRDSEMHTLWKKPSLYVQVLPRAS